MKGFLFLFFSLIFSTHLAANQPVLSVGEIAAFDENLVLTEKLVSPRKEGGVVMLVRNPFPGRILLLDAQGKIEKDLILDERHIDTADVFRENIEVIQLSSGNYVLASQNLDAANRSYYSHVVLSPDLEIVRKVRYDLSVGFRKVQSIYNSNDDTYTALFSTVSGIKRFKIVKFNIHGQEVWSKEQLLPGTVLAIQRVRFLALSNDNGFSYHTFIPTYICTNLSSLFSYWLVSHVFDNDGIQKHAFSRELSGYPYILNNYPSIHGCISDEGRYRYSFSFYTATSPFVRIYNISLPDNGNIKPEFIDLEHVYGGNLRSVINENGDVLSVGAKHLYIRMINENNLLEIIPLKRDDINQIGYLSFCRRPEGGWWVTGLIEYKNGEVDDILIGLPKQEYIVEGNVFKDLDENGVFEDEEGPFHTPWVNFNSTFDYFSKVKPDGSYSLKLGGGEYEIGVKINSDVWKQGENMQKADIHGDTILNLPIQAKVICPELSVNVVSPTLMRCQNNTYKVNYSNTGSDVAYQAYVEISLDRHLSITGSSLPYKLLSDGKLRFELSDIYPDEQGYFLFDAYLGCENTVSGQTHCVSAKIYPYENCVRPAACWDGSIIEIEGECVNDSAYFRIINRGNSSIAPRVMFVLEDDIMIRNPQSLTFERNEIKRFSYVANGRTIRIEVPQSECYPFKSNPSLVIEGCGGINKLGLVRTLPQDDDARFVSISCNESWDEVPEYFLKADPKGYGQEYYISDSTEIQYTFTFNTDFENNLYLMDTISDHLDINTLVINSSSHVYDYTLFNNGILKVDFEKSDSVTLGYFQFSVKPKKNRPVNTKIYNTGYFYKNLPQGFPSNTIFHTIGVRFLVVDIFTSVPEWKDKITTKVYPNPFGKEFRIDVAQQPSDMHVEVFDMQGKLIKRMPLNQSTVISTDGWSSGVYLFRILYQNEAISTGKLLKQ